MINKINSRVRGFVLVFTMLLILLITLIATSFTTTAIDDIRLANRIANTIRASYAADAGLADAMIRLRSYDPPPAAGFSINPTDVPLAATGVGSYSVQVNMVSSSGPYFKTYDIISTGAYPKVNGIARTMTLRVMVTSIAAWGYASETEHHRIWGDLYFITGMVIDGPINTNGQYNISGNPVFTGRVTSVSTSIHYYHAAGVDVPVFQAGVFLGSASVRLPQQTDMLQSIIDMSNAGGLHLKGGNASIKMNAGGDLTIQAKNDKSGLYTTPTTIPIPSNKVIYAEGGDVSLQGNLNGILTIGTDKNIWIDSNIKYHDKTGVDYTGSDMLGLVALNNITVSKSARGNSGLEIDAYLVAINGSFQVDHFNDYNINGDLVQFGGLCNFMDGPTGMFNPLTNKIVSGYNQICQYDARFGDVFTSTLPVGFPPARDSNNRIAYRKVSFSES